LVAALIREFEFAKSLLDDVDASLLTSRLQSRAPSYTVNHVERLLAMHLLNAGRFEFASGVSDFENSVDDKCVRELLPDLRVEPMGRNNNPRATMVRLTARRGAGPRLAIIAELDVAFEPRLRLLSARTSK
jgi:hypothetical protein